MLFRSTLVVTRAHRHKMPRHKFIRVLFTLVREVENMQCDQMSTSYDHSNGKVIALRYFTFVILLANLLLLWGCQSPQLIRKQIDECKVATPVKPDDPCKNNSIEAYTELVGNSEIRYSVSYIEFGLVRIHR